MTLRHSGISKLPARSITSIAGARNILTSTKPDTSSPSRCRKPARRSISPTSSRKRKARGLKFPAADPFPGYSAAPRRVDQPGVPQFDHGIQLPGQISRRVSDQGESAARSGGRNSRCRQAVSISAWKSAASRNCSPAWRCKTRPSSLIICNGYKDASFIRMALMGIKLGKKVIMVVEKLEELRQIISVSKQLGVEPLIGIRARLLSKGAGKWAESGGENAKFGLSTAELLAATELLQGREPDALFQAAAFPYRLAGPGYSDGQESGAGSGALLRQAPQDGFPDRIPGCRRRLGRGLRRQPFRLRQLDQLHAAGIHQRHRLLHRATSATRRKCRIRTSSAKAAAPSWRITAC